jgi:hypothetical protein
MTFALVSIFLISQCIQVFIKRKFELHAGFVVSIAANYSSSKKYFHSFFYQVYILYTAKKRWAFRIQVSQIANSHICRLSKSLRLVDLLADPTFLCNLRFCDLRTWVFCGVRNCLKIRITIICRLKPKLFDAFVLLTEKFLESHIIKMIKDGISPCSIRTLTMLQLTMLHATLYRYSCDPLPGNLVVQYTQSK